MPKKDINQTAFDVVRRATGELPEPVESAKAKAGRIGGQKGGMVRASALTPAERSAIAKRAATARWQRVKEGVSPVSPVRDRKTSRKTRRKDA